MANAVAVKDPESAMSDCDWSEAESVAGRPALSAVFSGQSDSVPGVVSHPQATDPTVQTKDLP